MTEVVRDTDVAAADPHESLPPAMPLPPWSRFARPRPPQPKLPGGGSGAGTPGAGGPGGGALASPAVARKRSGALAGAGAGQLPWGLAGPAGALPVVEEAQGRAGAELMDPIDGGPEGGRPEGGRGLRGCGLARVGKGLVS